MSRYIDADKLKEMVNRQYSYCHGYTGTKKDIYREALLAVKSAIHCQSVSKDMQEVIRCKDCEHCLYINDRYMCKRNAIYNDSYKEFYGLCAVAKDHFCSYGERKE